MFLPPRFSSSSSSLAYALGVPPSQAISPLEQDEVTGPTIAFSDVFPTPRIPDMASGPHVTNTVPSFFIQRAIPAATFHTFLPPGISSSSSSLAHALGVPPSQAIAPLEQEVTASTVTFSDVVPSARIVEIFPLDEKERHTTPKLEPASVFQESPDPLDLFPSVFDSPSSIITPRGPLTPSSSASKPSARRTLAYVEVPSLPKACIPKRPTLSSNIRYKDRKTGDRDERAPLEKFMTLLEAIFQAEDDLVVDAQAHDLPAEFFSPFTVDSAHPLLNSNVTRKLTKYITQVTSSVKRLRRSQNDSPSSITNTPLSDGRISHVATPTISRLLKILDRSVRAGENLAPFRVVEVHEESGACGRAIDKNESPVAPESAAIHLDALSKTLDIAKDSILAADCCLALLGSDRLVKELYSEELISACLSTVKNQLTEIIFPFVEASGKTCSRTNVLLDLLVNHVSSASRHRHQLSQIFQALSTVLSRVTNLLCSENLVMSDSIIIQAIYIAISPFFVAEVGNESNAKVKKDQAILSTLCTSAMRSLRLDALFLIRGIFANHKNQRSWIIEEILVSMIKLSDSKLKSGHFRLRDGRTIRTVSALLLQLVQTSAHDVRDEARKIATARQPMFSQDGIDDPSASRNLNEHDDPEVRLYKSGLDSATKAAKTIILFLTQRSGRTKTTKNSNEAEYRAIFYNLVSDLLTVLYWPEWPAASLLLGIASRYMVASLDDAKALQKEENSAAKTIALEHLGLIAARIQSGVLRYKSANVGIVVTAPLKSLDEVVTTLDVEALERLLSVYQEIAYHICKRSAEDQIYESARELFAASFGQEVVTALTRINAQSNIAKSENPPSDFSNILLFGQILERALRDIWKDYATDVFDTGSQDEIARIDRLSEEFGAVQGLNLSFQPILNVIITALDAPPVFMRTKALRALGQIVSSDPNILSASNVRRSIENHLLDNSPAVRDVAVELIGKVMIENPKIAGEYYQKIADRIADTGLVVRKRVVKLLKALYSTTDDITACIDMSARLILRVVDEDDSVRCLAVKAIEELWFQDSNPSSRKFPCSSDVSQEKNSLLAKVAIIMGVSTNFKDRQFPLEDMLHRVIEGKQENEVLLLHTRYREVCESLIDGLVDASELPGFTVLNCIRTIYFLASAYPGILSVSQASILLPYLKNATNPEEQAISDFLLRIYRMCIPHMPKTAAKFGSDLQLALQPMILKPSSSGGLQALQESVACICATVKSLTHDAGRLVALLKSCNARLQQDLGGPPVQTSSSQGVRTLSVLIFIISLLGEHYDFDQLREENNPLFTAELDKVTRGPVIDHIYKCLLALHEKYSDSNLRGRILQCLGFLFRAHPTLMVEEHSAAIMDSIFSSSDEEGHGRLMKIIQEFLISQSYKNIILERGKGKLMLSSISMEELVGDTEGFADSGVSSAVVQRYLPSILNAALSKNPQIQAVAVDVLSFTVKQGLAHPLQSFPIIVALETSLSTHLSSRANALHAILHSKYSSLLSTRHISSARVSFDYQKALMVGPVYGFRMQPLPIALLQPWYSLVREKRTSRQDFLRTLVKVFDVNIELLSTQDDVDFVRYMAENFSAFEYKTQEEVLTVISFLTLVLSTAGMQLVDILSPSNLLTQLRGHTHNADTPLFNASLDIEHSKSVSALRNSIVIGIIMLLKSYLKSSYGLSEEKCSKFVQGKKSAVGDRPAIRRTNDPISWDRIPFATIPMASVRDAEEQKEKFMEIWNEHGLTVEPEEFA